MTDDLEAWLVERFAQERARVLEEVAQAVGRLLDERRNDRDREIGELWKALATVQGSLAELHANPRDHWQRERRREEAELSPLWPTLRTQSEISRGPRSCQNRIRAPQLSINLSGRGRS